MENVYSNKELGYSFINTRSQICIYERYRYISNVQFIQWSQVFRIIYFKDDPCQCSICLSEPFMPRSDNCGHIFCLCCLINLLKHNDYHKVLCPICKKQEISLETLKRVDIIEETSVTRDCTVQLNLLVKGRESFFPSQAVDLPHYMSNVVPCSKRKNNICYCKISTDSDNSVMEALEGDIELLRSQEDFIIQTNGESVYERTNVFLFQELSRFQMETMITDYSRSKEQRRSDGCRFNLLNYDQQLHLFDLFYQCNNYRYTFLEPDQTSDLIASNLIMALPPPVKVVALVESFRQQVVDSNFIRQTRMCHLPLGATITWVRVRLSHAGFYEMHGDKMKKLVINKNHMAKAMERSERWAREMAVRVQKNPTNVRRIVADQIKGKTEIKDGMVPYVTDGFEGFNTCTLGLECIVPDDDYPHAEDCIYYKPPVQQSNDESKQTFEARNDSLLGSSFDLTSKKNDSEDSGLFESLANDDFENLDLDSNFKGFNSCTLGIKCLIPDDDFPHAEDCIHYKPPDESFIEKLFIETKQDSSAFEGFNTCTLGLPCYVPDDDFPHAEDCTYYKPTINSFKSNIDDTISAEYFVKPQKLHLFDEIPSINPSLIKNDKRSQELQCQKQDSKSICSPLHKVDENDTDLVELSVDSQKFINCLLSKPNGYTDSVSNEKNICSIVVNHDRKVIHKKRKNDYDRQSNMFPAVKSNLSPIEVPATSHKFHNCFFGELFASHDKIPKEKNMENVEIQDLANSVVGRNDDASVLEHSLESQENSLSKAMLKIIEGFHEDLLDECTDVLYSTESQEYPDKSISVRNYVNSQIVLSENISKGKSKDAERILKIEETELHKDRRDENVLIECSVDSNKYANKRKDKLEKKQRNVIKELIIPYDNKIQVNAISNLKNMMSKPQKVAQIQYSDENKSSVIYKQSKSEIPKIKLKNSKVKEKMKKKLSNADDKKQTVLENKSNFTSYHSGIESSTSSSSSGIGSIDNSCSVKQCLFDFETIQTVDLSVAAVSEEQHQPVVIITQSRLMTSKPSEPNLIARVRSAANRPLLPEFITDEVRKTLRNPMLPYLVSPRKGTQRSKKNKRKLTKT